MYVVESGNGYVLDPETLLMTSEIEEAKRMGHGEACEVVSRIEEQGFDAETIRVSSSTVKL
jgi:hypothetical protein